MANLLQHSTSPYLQQHAENPVAWRPWSDEVFEEAKREDKMVLISIGYAACHWCHVMERESFTDKEIAELMNRYFIPVKVDREERPDVDQIFMNAVQLINRQGGWPLTCFTLPDGSPFFGGTYFPPKEFQGILQSLAATWLKERPRILDAAKQVKEGLLKTDIISRDTKSNNQPDEEFLHEYVNGWEFQFDSYNGGNTGAPKFPLPSSLAFLLEYGERYKSNMVKEHVNLTLDRMINGGIFDHVGGGFARYTTDKKWRIPHFEKMLYDNGQLLSLLAQHYKAEPKKETKQVIQKTIEFLKRDMMAENHGFYSSWDADSEGEEGRFYVWTKKEIDDILKDQAAVFQDFYNISEAGNWEDGKNILYSEKPLAAVAKKHGLNIDEASKLVDKALLKLFLEREKREKPGLDNKQLVSWNAMAIDGLVEAFQALGKPEYLDMAVRTGAFIRQHAMKEKQLLRNCRQDDHSIPALLEDYAFSIQAFIKLFETTADESWLEDAEHLMSFTLEHFKDPSTAMFFQTQAEHAPLNMRKMEIMDNVIPSANSVMAQNLYRLSVMKENHDYREHSLQMLQNMKQQLQHHGPFFSNWMKLWMWFSNPPYEVAVCGPSAEEKIRSLQQRYLPVVSWAWSQTKSQLSLLQNRCSDESLIYLCRNFSCQEPLKNTDQAVAVLLEQRF